MPEISQAFYHTFNELGAPGTIWYHVGDISLNNEQKEHLRKKQIESPKKRARAEWHEAIQLISDKYLQTPLTDREKIFIVSMLYWGEGQKRDLNITNGDPALIYLFKECLQDVLKIKNERFTFNLLVYEDLDLDACVHFWTTLLNISPQQLTHVHRRAGKEHGKLKYGICRLRVVRGGFELKQIMSLAKLTFKLLDLGPHSSAR